MGRGLPALSTWPAYVAALNAARRVGERSGNDARPGGERYLVGFVVEDARGTWRLASGHLGMLDDVYPAHHHGSLKLLYEFGEHVTHAFDCVGIVGGTAA